MWYSNLQRCCGRRFPLMSCIRSRWVRTCMFANARPDESRLEQVLKPLHRCYPMPPLEPLHEKDGTLEIQSKRLRNGCDIGEPERVRTRCQATKRELRVLALFWRFRTDWEKNI